MSGKIKKGDVVRCINANVGQSIVNGQLYTVIDIDVMKGKYVLLSGEGLPPSHSYSISRFEPFPQGNTKIAEVL